MVLVICEACEEMNTHLRLRLELLDIFTLAPCFPCRRSGR